MTNPNVVRQDLVVDAQQRSNILPTQFIIKLTLGSTTPSVSNVTRAKAINVAPITITNFTNGQEGQEIQILGDGNTTFADNLSIKTLAAADTLMVFNKIYKFTMFDSIWIEH
jgi:hypothetical protein